MVIQQRDYESLAAYVHHFKTEAKRCDFNSDTTAIHIFVNGLCDAHNIMAKINEKDLPDLIRGNQISREAQHGTTGYSYLDTPYSQYDFKWWQMFCMWQDRSYWSPLPQCTVLCSTAQRKFSHQEHHTIMTDHGPNYVTTITTETDHRPFITDTVREDTSLGQDHTTNLNVAETPATTGGMHPIPHPDTTTDHDTHPPKMI